MENKKRQIDEVGIVVNPIKDQDVLKEYKKQKLGGPG
jgi:hypothetical protein